jgi:DNA-binding NarL/FixJ family response regulator
VSDEAAKVTLRVVLADDSPDYRMLLRHPFLFDERLDVVGEAGDGEEALKAVSALRPDVVLLDMAMPMSEGLAVIPRMRGESPGTRIVVLTGFARNSDEALEAGATSYLDKDTMPEAVADHIVALCARTDEEA